MRYRKFGDTDLEASEIGFGTWAIGSDWWGDVSSSEGERMLSRAFELGITFFDTGDVYEQGENEKLVGKTLGKVRDRVQLSTKFGYDFMRERAAHEQGERPQDFTPSFARKALEASLERLGTDYIDLYQLHNPRMNAVECDELFDELEKLKTEGKIREYGVSLGPAIGWRDEGIKALTRRNIAALQTVYNMLEQEPGSEFMKLGEQVNVGIMARVPTSSGLLEGKFTLDTEFSGSDHRRHRSRKWLVDGLNKVEKLSFLHEGGDRTLAQASMKFILMQPSVTCVIPTVTDISELEEWAATSDQPELEADQIACIKELYERNFDLELVET